MPEPTASAFGARFVESYEQPYLKDFVQKRRANVQREMTSKARKKEFYLPQAKHPRRTINTKRSQQQRTSAFEIDRVSYGLAYVGATPLKQTLLPHQLFSGASHRRQSTNISQKLSSIDALSSNTDRYVKEAKGWLSSA